MIILLPNPPKALHMPCTASTQCNWFGQAGSAWRDGLNNVCVIVHVGRAEGKVSKDV